MDLGGSSVGEESVMKRLIIGIIAGLVLIAGLLAVTSSKWWPRGEVSGRQSAATGQKNQGGDAEGSHPGARGQGPGAGAEGIQLTDEEQERLGLETVPVQERVIQDVFTVSGVIKAIPDQIASVSSRVEGRVIRVLGNVGEIVQEGQVLAQLKAPEGERLQTELLQARNRLGWAEADLERIRYLVERGISARKDLLEKEAEVRGTRKEIEGLENQLKLLGIEEGELEPARMGQPLSLSLKAPIGGAILSREVTVGEVVSPGKVLFKLADLRRVYAEGEAFEAHAASLKKGLPVKVQAPAYPDRTFSGRIAGIGYEVEPERRTLRFWAELGNRGLLLKPNMSAQLTVMAGQRGKVLSIPLEAVIQEGGESFVFVVEGDRFRRVPVSLGVKDDRYAEVKGGGKAGDLVVTTGKRQLYTVYRMGRSGEELKEMGSVD
ncbi:MAG: efflux RND transporter periplasmic adaptor subunit [candidate division NC10 bacterium]|nr:efflux RND transporter periplasmic adaptor subunit [candidate division NC10 bacterium]